MAESIHSAELDAAFDSYRVVESGVNITVCEPNDEYKASYWARIHVDEVFKNEVYDALVRGKQGLSEVEGASGISAGYEVEGVAGRAFVDRDAMSDYVKFAINTGCYSRADAGVGDPFELER